MSKVFYNLNLFNGYEEKITEDAWFVVNDEGRIEEIGTGEVPSADESFDLKGQYVMPGLFNVHTHITSNPYSVSGGRGANETEVAIHAYQNLQELLKSGVTYIRECGASYDSDIKIRNMRARGEVPRSPHIMASGKYFSMSGGHGDLRENSHTTTHVVDSPDEVRKGVRKAFKNGADNIKMMATGGVLSNGDAMDQPQSSYEELRAAVIEVRNRGKVSCAHAQGEEGIQNAIDAGIDSIEHAFYTTDKQADQMIKQGTYIVPTLTAITGIAYYGKEDLADWLYKKADDAVNDAIKNLSHAYKKGVKFALGTDAGTPFNDFSRTPDEIVLMVELLGMTPFDAYYTSVNASKLCKVDEDYGTLEVGKFADFIAMDNDPLEDYKALQQKDKEVYLSGERQF